MLLMTSQTVFAITAESADSPVPVLSETSPRCVAEGEAVSIAVTDREIVVIPLEGPERRIVHAVPQLIASCLLVERDNAVEVLLGTVGSRLFHCSLAGGETQAVTSFDQLPCRNQWHTPWGGPAAVRSLAMTPDGWIYADIHVGSIMRSRDWGHNWEPVTPTLNEDVHEVATCPAAPAAVYANTALAVYVSNDRGMSWDHRAKDLGERYGRAMAVHPQQPEVLLATVSDGPHEEHVHGQLFRSEDGGRTWAHVVDGFPASTAENIDTFHVVFDKEGGVWAACGQHLFRSEDTGISWREKWQAPENITMLSCR